MALSLFFSLLILTSLNAVISDPPPQQKTALLSFLSQVHHQNRIQWNASTSPCNWTGVTCDATRTAVEELRLPAVGLVGPIPPNTIGHLSSLRVLSLRHNGLTGSIPDDFSNLTLLFSLYLQDNAISGNFPPSLTSLTRLTRLNLAGNNFSGQIPFALNNLTHLTALLLDRNRFSGSLPSINITSLQGFNVSDNTLNGSIPETLARFPKSSFAGNLQLCGNPLPPCTPFFPSPSPSPSISPPSNGSHHKKLSTAAIIAIAVGVGGFLILLALLLFICLIFKRRKREGGSRSKATKAGAVPAAAGAGAAGVREVGMTSSSKDDMSGVVEGERNRLAFVGKGGGYSFDLEDLLRASAEVLGKGSVGTSYKAILEEGTTVVVKRLKDVAASKREFELQMEELGKVEHDNLLPLRAYYYSKDEKLLVFDFLPAGSLSSVLHGELVALS